MTSEHDDMLDRNLSRLLSNGAERPALDPDRRADMLDALLARQAELRPAKETTMAPSPWRKRLLIAAATAAAVLAVWLGFPRLLPPPAGQPDYTVIYGENANVGEPVARTLADGTIVISKPGTEFAVGEPRFLYLTQGDLYLIVAKSDAPFVVHSKHGMAIAHGTRFAASVDDSLRVAVAQGTVTVKNDEGSVDVGVGQETEARSGQAPTRRPAPRLSYVVNWAREKLAQAKRLVPKSEQTGALVAQDPWGQEAKLSLRKYHVDVHIEDGIARTTVDQTFFNHLNWNTEGTFTFPLPPGASVSRLAMYVGGALNEGGMVERSRGQAIYTEIKFQRRDPALLEMMEGNVFKLRIFPLEGRREKRIFLSYTQKLDELYGTMRYWFPMDHTHSTTDLLSIRVRGKGMAGHYIAHSSTHNIDAHNDMDDLVMAYEAENAKPDQDLLIHFVPKAGKRSTAVATAEKDGFRYLFARIAPTLSGKMEPVPRAWIVLNDVSASRTKLDVQAQAHILERLLLEADDEDTVALVNVDVTAHAQGEGFVSIRDDAARKKLVAAAQVDLPLGGTNLAAGLEAAAKLIADHKAENVHILYLGDGVATDGRTSVDEILTRLPEGATFVAVGVGKKADSTLLQAAADATGGMFTLINPDEDMDWRVFDLVAALNTPRLVGLTCEFDTDATAYPSARALADGETLFVAARTQGQRPSRMTLRGQVAGEPFEQVVHLDDARSGTDYIPRFWASRHIESLLKDGPEHREEIVKLAKQYYVMTPYTSLIVLENDKMYEEFKVERGRKDHWALYPAPKKIEVVHEPMTRNDWSWWGDWQTEDGKVKAKADPKSVQDVVDSVQFRLNAPFLYWPRQRSTTARFSLYNLLESKADASGFVAAVVHLGARASGKLPEGGEGEGQKGRGEAADRPMDPPASRQPMPPSVVSSPVMAGEMLPSMFFDGRFDMRRGLVDDRVSRDFFLTGVGNQLDLGEGQFVDKWSLVTDGLSSSENGIILNRGALRLGRGESGIDGYLGALNGRVTNEFFLDGGSASLGTTAFSRRAGLGLLTHERFIGGDKLQSAGGWYEEQFPVSGLVSGEFGQALPQQLGYGLNKALGNRFQRIERDVRRHNRMYGSYHRRGYSTWGRQSIDLSRAHSYRNLYEWSGTDDFDGDVKDVSVSFVLDPLPATAIMAYDRAVKTVPGTMATMTADYILPRMTALNGGTRSKRDESELGFLRSSVANIQFAYPHIEDSGIFWGHQGWKYRPQPWTLQVPQVQTHHGYNWAFDLTRYAPGLYSTTFDIVALVAEKFKTPPRGAVSDEAAAAIAAAREAVQPMRIRFGKEGPALLVGKGDRFALTRTTDMYLEERLVCDGAHVVQIYAELGLAARRPATGLRRAALRQAVPHLIAPAAWLARSYKVELTAKTDDGFTLELRPEPEGIRDIRMLVAVAADGRILSKTLRVDDKTRLTLTYTYEGGRVKPTWTTPDGKTHEGAELVAEPFTPDADTFRADTAGRTVIDMPLRRPEHYAAKLEAATDAADIARLNRHFALAHIQELQWRRWGRQNPKALEAMQKVADAIGKKADGTLNLTLGDITLLGSAGQRYTAETWAKKSGIADNTPVLAYYAKRHHGWQKVAELRKSVPGGLIGHLAAYHAAIASGKDVAPMASLIRDFGRSPLLYAAAAWQEQPERLLELTDHPRWGLLAIVKAAQRAKTDVHRDHIAAAFAKMHAKLTDAGAELPIPPKIAALLKRGDGAHWKAVLAGARKVAFDSKHIAPLLRLAELAMLNAETALADEAVAQARSLAGEDRPLLLALTVAQAYWAGNRQKDALALYEQVLATLKKKDVPPSATLLAAAARLAQQAGDMGKAIDLEERALAIEHETLPEMINLQAFRQRYQWLWARYQEKVNQAVQAKKLDEAAQWVDRAARLWRRWFDVDGENRGLLTQMATLQLTAGNKDAAWLYLSSLIDAKPKDAGTFAHLAQWHLGRKEHAKAADYYAQAFTWDTANPQWLYQQGQALKTLGRTEDANRVLDQIIDGKWAPGLQRYQKRAKELKDK